MMLMDIKGRPRTLSLPRQLPLPAPYCTQPKFKSACTAHGHDLIVFLAELTTIDAMKGVDYVGHLVEVAEPAGLFGGVARSTGGLEQIIRVVVQGVVEVVIRLGRAGVLTCLHVTKQRQAW